MENIFLDTNVVIDLLEKRENFYSDAAQIFNLAYQKKIKLFISPLTFATASFLLRKHPKDELMMLLTNLRKLVDITIADSNVIDNALSSSFKDFEDAIQYFSALTSNVDVLITRNLKDFHPSEIETLSPKSFLEIYNR
jgi:predicted nucleic acid-binding protein